MRIFPPTRPFPRVFCGFPGVGKTTWVTQLRQTSPTIKITDVDSAAFDKRDFPDNYIAHIKTLLEQDHWVLCSTHAAVRSALVAEAIDYVLILPSRVYLKDEYLQRYRDRGSPQAFLDLMEREWETSYNDLWNDYHGLHFGLDSGEYISDHQYLNQAILACVPIS